MTAEVAIMNGTAIALAADSAVTITTESGQKVFNTVNKLFTLSKYQPVGVMIYGNASLMDVPWETIIKIYRRRLKDRKFNTLKEYADDFIGYLGAATNLFPDAQQAEHFHQQILAFYSMLLEEIDKCVKEAFDQNARISQFEITNIIDTVVNSALKELQKLPFLPHMSAAVRRAIIKKYRPIIQRASEQVFHNLPIATSSRRQLIQAAADTFCKEYFPFPCSGVVIAGFGEAELFPSLVNYQIGSVLDNLLKYRLIGEPKIDFKQTAAVVPFAQREMVELFIQGIEQRYRNNLEGNLSKLFEEFPRQIANALPDEPGIDKGSIQSVLRSIGETLLDDFRRALSNYSNERHVHPVLNTISVLPKDELADLAESLVNLTKLKRRVSLDAETVGGPVDVAVISKGDGFIWIQRKHYFKPELNPRFGYNYFREEPSDGTAKTSDST